MNKKKYQMKHRFAYIQYEVNELGITIQSSPWTSDIEKWKKEQQIYFDEAEYLYTLQALGYDYYEKDPEKADINDYEYIEKEEPIEINADNEGKIDIRELYESSNSFKPIVSGISIGGIEKMFKDSSVESQISFTKALEDNIKELEDQCITIENTLIRFEKRKYTGDKATKINDWSYDLNQKELDILREISVSNKLLDHLVMYLNNNGYRYDTGDREIFGSGKIKSERILPKVNKK
jgi:hypothetical protein